jgi:hypothetical protein
MSAVLRKALAAATAAFLPVGSLCALFLHAHVDDHDTPHHQGHAIHAHFSEHPIAAPSAPAHAPRGRSADPAIDHDESERTLTLQVFVAVSPDGHFAPALPVVSFAIAVAQEPAPRPMRQVSHGHDPPLLLPLAPRPPPTLVS